MLGRSFTQEMALRAVTLTGGCIVLILTRLCISSHQMLADVGSLDSISRREGGTVGSAATSSSVLDIVTQAETAAEAGLKRFLFQACGQSGSSTLRCSPGGLVGGPAVLFVLERRQCRNVTRGMVHHLGTWWHMAAGDVFVHSAEAIASLH